MGIIIKGVEMPASCSACPLADEYINNLCKKVFYCKAGNIKAEGEAAFEKRADGCPLENTAKGSGEMTRTILRLGHFTRADEFDRIKKEWEQENPDTCLIPYTMKLERGRAKWEQHGYLGLTYWTCSACGKPYNKIKDFHYCPDFNYCPNCGAEMEGVK